MRGLFTPLMGQEEPTRDAKMAVLAGRQHGVVAYGQLRRLGLSARAIEYRLRTGRLHRLHKGVYAVGHAAVTAEGRAFAAVLACGPGAVLSHWSAAWLWGLLRRPPDRAQVTAAGDRQHRPGIRVHRVKGLHPHDVRRHQRIPVTSVARTLLDIAADAKPRQLTRAVNQADRRGRLNRRAVHELLERNPRRSGSRALRAAIAMVDPSTRRTRSDLEAAFLGLLRRRRIEPPLVNAIVEGHEVDMYWPRQRLIVELDFYDYHRTPGEFATDRLRDAVLKTKDHEVLRVPDAWLERDPDAVADTVEELLRRRARAAAPRSPSARAA